jgi:hypothetical protein
MKLCYLIDSLNLKDILNSFMIKTMIYHKSQEITQSTRLPPHHESSILSLLIFSSSLEKLLSQTHGPQRMQSELEVTETGLGMEARS